jgi:4-alpha-glucanotransferase
MNLLGTHDTERILTVLGREDDHVGVPKSVLARMRLSPEERRVGIDRLKVAAAIQFTAYGIPSVYYGDEVGLEGYGDPFCRMPMPWNDMDKEYRREILEYYKMLGRMRLEEDAFSGGEFYILSHTESSIAYVREKNDSKILVIANMGDSFTLPLDGDAEYKNIETGEIVSSRVDVMSSSVLLLKQTKG